MQCTAYTDIKHAFKYLTTGELSDDDKINKTTLLMCDQYVVENDGIFPI